MTLFPTDQILLARLLGSRGGGMFHAAGVIFGEKGLLFAGHSGAGKSTMATMLKGKAETLCDDRIVVRPEGEGFRIYGTWSHGTVPDVSAATAPLTAILFLEQATENRLVPLSSQREIVSRMLSVVVKPLVTADWWENTLSVVEKVAGAVPCYTLRFDKSGRVCDLLERL